MFKMILDPSFSSIVCFNIPPGASLLDSWLPPGLARPLRQGLMGEAKRETKQETKQGKMLRWLKEMMH